MGTTEVQSGNATDGKGSEGGGTTKATTKGVLIAGFLMVVLAAILIGVIPDWKKDGPGGDDGGTTESEVKYLESTSGPFNVSIPLFSPDVTRGYETLDDAKTDIEEMLKFILNEDITNNKKQGDVYMRQPGVGFDGETDDMDMAAPVAAPPADSATAEESGGSVTDVGDDQTDFETNNQEANVDIADMVKSNGEYLFASYGDYLLVISVATGDVVSNIQMDQIPQNENCNDMYPEPRPFPIEEEEPAVDVEEPAEEKPPVEEDGNSGGSDAAPGAEPDQEEIVAAEPAIAAKSMVYDPCWYQPKPYIQTIILDGDRLTLVVSGYGNQYITPYWGGPLDDGMLEGEEGVDTSPPILYDYLSTRINVYEIQNGGQNGGQLVFLTSKDVHGSYRDAFTITDNATGKSSTHVVTQQSWDHYRYLQMPLQRWNPEFLDLSDDEYEDAAIKKGETLVGGFATKLIDEINAMGVDVNLVKLSLFVEDIPDNIDEYDIPFWRGGFPNAITYIFSFDSEDATASDEELDVNASGVAMPSSWGHVYANENTLWIAGQGWNWAPFRNANGETTYMVGFDVDGTTATARAVGTIPGFLLNPYSLDFEGDNLRVATTQRFWRFPIRAAPVVDVAVDVAVDEMDTAVSTTAEGDGDEDDKEEDRDDEEPEEEEDDFNTTLNQIIVFNVPAADGTDPVKLDEIGSVELGKKHEVFTTVRFFPDVAYAATFERVDPFYVIHFKNGVPEVAGELDDIPGFSSYLHSVNSDNSKLIAVGQYADDDGRVLGLQISLFDATDDANPKLIANHIEEQDENTHSSSEAQWEYKAVRYLRIDDDRGRLIVPLQIWVWDPIIFEPEPIFVDGEEKPEEGEDVAEEPAVFVDAEPVLIAEESTSSAASTVVSSNEGSFNGFAVFAVEDDKIHRQFYISHEDQTIEYSNSCWSCGWLAPRSFVFSGDVVTMKGQTIHRTDLNAQDDEPTVWSTNVVTDTNPDQPLECCGW